MWKGKGGLTLENSTFSSCQRSLTVYLYSNLKVPHMDYLLPEHEIVCFHSEQFSKEFNSLFLLFWTVI